MHPQFWPEDLDYAGKRIVVIGSGATAVTLVPALAERAAHVTMLQRSPTLHPLDPVRGPDRERACGGCSATARAYPLARWKNVVISTLIYQAQPAPAAARCAR